LSRLYLTTGMLLEGGIPILAALDIVGDAVSPNTRGHCSLRAASSPTAAPVAGFREQRAGDADCPAHAARR
jgi:general secretion pathway protein F